MAEEPPRDPEAVVVRPAEDAVRLPQPVPAAEVEPPLVVLEAGPQVRQLIL